MRQKKFEQVDEYLKSLYELAIQFGRFNKPILVSMAGPVYNSAASILSQVPFTLAQESSVWKQQEINFGYVPDCGSSYYLSRLPGTHTPRIPVARLRTRA